MNEEKGQRKKEIKLQIKGYHKKSSHKIICPLKIKHQELGKRLEQHHLEQHHRT